MRKLLVRDFSADDASIQDTYFQAASEKALLDLGVNPARVKSVKSDPAVFRRRLEIPISEREAHDFAIDLDGKNIGVVTLKEIKFGASCLLHGHIYETDLRGLRLGTQAFVLALDQAFSRFQLVKIIAEPTTSNTAANALLQSVGLGVVATFPMPASGYFIPRTVNHYEISRDWFYRELRSKFL